ncbi:hypothetical protein JMJ35_000339 [Cladonia borealis]|uniref:Uncharacterized protein n=1 Tax=Cladonia borealis TaxID=184061 RepID=A0AA39V7V6_9LECA|nr:hypothetical protein JMJ35_000339 [Cladonia borealis]
MSSKKLYNNPQSSPQSPNPTHIANMASDSSSSGGLPGWLIALIVLTTIGAVVVGVYMSPVGEDVTKWAMEKFFKAEAKAEEKALEKAGETKAEGFLKDRLKKNPVVSNDELNQISGGLGDEAAKEFGKGGLGKGIGKAFD